MAEAFKTRSFLEIARDYLCDSEELEALTDEDFLTIIENVFDEICGENGKSEFFSFTLPKAQFAYGKKRIKMLKRLLGIIVEGAKKKKKRKKFFIEAISETEIQFKKRPIEAILKEVTDRIKEALLAHNENFPDSIVAVAIFGSYAQGNPRFTSDLDISYIGKTYNYGDKELNNLRLELYLATAIELDETIAEALSLDDKTVLKAALSNTDVLVVTPFEDVEKKIENILYLES